MAKTRAQENRAIRQENLREWLSKKCTLQHLVDNILKIEELGLTVEDGLDPKKSQQQAFMLNKLKVANEQRIKLLSKYLPDLKAMELTGEGGGPMQFEEWLDELSDQE